MIKRIAWGLAWIVAVVLALWGLIYVYYGMQSGKLFLFFPTAPLTTILTNLAMYGVYFGPIIVLTKRKATQ